MPIIATFLGLVIRLYHDDHDPPHVHVQYGEFQAVVQISNSRILAGRLPPRVKRLLGEWMKANREAINNSWEIARRHGTPPRVRPLE